VFRVVLVTSCSEFGINFDLIFKSTTSEEAFEDEITFTNVQSLPPLLKSIEGDVNNPEDNLVSFFSSYEALGKLKSRKHKPIHWP
jgi:hypothetical protein